MVPAMALVVHLRNAVALTGRFPALAGVDLDAAAGEVLVLEGANGAGKTSVLRLCAGLLPATSGVVCVLGHDLRRDRGAVRRRVGMLGHAAALYDELTVVENLRFAVRAGGGDLSRLPGVMERLDLVGRLPKTPVGRLSAGQRRRVDLAALVARRPELWLLDEPHASFDATGRALVDTVIRDAAAAGATVLVASHELDMVLPLADRVLTVAGGRVVGQWSASPGSADRVSPSQWSASPGSADRVSPSQWSASPGSGGLVPAGHVPGISEPASPRQPGPVPVGSTEVDATPVDDDAGHQVGAHVA